MVTPARLQLTGPGAAGAPGSAEAHLRRAAAALEAARAAAGPDERFAAAHLAALRAAAAVVAARGRPPSLRRRLVTVWVLLERVAPEFAGEAAYFAAGAKARAAIEAGAYGVVSLRAADDQLRAATDFLCSVECRIGGAQPALAG
jgi:hypothetical protein